MGEDSFPVARQFSGYLVQRRLGAGASSAIFEVLDPRAGECYALKRVVRRTASDERFFRQCENEFDTARRIDHPVIRKIHRFIRIRRLFRVREIHLVMEMFYGQTLESHRPTNPLEIVRIFRSVAEGLDAMHAAGFAHADIKPNNILVDSGGQVKVIDLGQSCPLGAVKQRIQGTPDYIAPEQVYRRPIDQRTDVFNVGATLYWVLTNEHMPTVLPKAMPGRDIALVTATVVRPPIEVNPHVPPALSKLIMDCVSLNPADRPASMKILNARLETIEIILGNGRQPGSQSVEEDDDLDDASDTDPEADTIDLDGPQE